MSRLRRLTDYLLDHYERHNLVAAMVQLVLCAAVLAYGFSRLGLQMACPALAVMGGFVLLMWLTLHSPWDDDGDDGPFQRRRFGLPPLPWGGLSESRMVYAAAFALAATHVRSLELAKEQISSARTALEDPLAAVTWISRRQTLLDDTYGWLLLTENGMIGLVWFPLLLLGIVWLILPR